MTSRWVNPINNNILRDLQDNVLANGSVAFYAAGTSTPLAVYSDPELAVSLGSYIDADAYGLLPDFHMAAGTQYKMVAYDAIGGAGGAGAVKWTRDDVFSADSSVDTRLDDLEASVAALEDIGRNSIQNGGCSAESLDTDQTVITAPNLTTSFAEGQVKGVFAKVANVTAGTSAIGYTTDVESGAYLHLSGVTTNNAAATADALFLVKSGEAARFVNKQATFRCKVYHDIGSNTNFTVTVAILNSRDDISAYTTVLAGSATAVANADWTTLTLTVPDMGNSANGIAVIVSGAVGTITTKNIRYSVAMMDIGGTLTSFTETDPNIVEPALNAQSFAELYTAQEIADFAQRGAGQPWLNGIGAVTTYTTGSGNFTVPAGVYRVKYTITGGGGGGGGRGAGAADGGNGGDTVFNTSITAGGGVGGESDNGYPGKAGGTATGGDINIPGGGTSSSSSTSQAAPGGASIWGGGGFGGQTGGGASGNGGDGQAYGSGGGAASTGSNCSTPGSSGGTCIGILTVTPGDLIPYSVGAAGTAGAGAQTGGAGAGGIIVLEY